MKKEKYMMKASTLECSAEELLTMIDCARIYANYESYPDVETILALIGCVDVISPEE